MIKTISNPNLSGAWAEALVYIYDNPGREIAPLVFNINGFNNGNAIEVPGFRGMLDDLLIQTGNQSVNTVANTIFPASLWRLAAGDRNRLYHDYKKAFPRYQKLEPYKNRRGIYFQRLISYEQQIGQPINQLEHIICSYNQNHGVVRMKLQASIFDPTKDHVRDARIGFPCLQHLSVVPKGNQLSLNCFYATQLLFEKAYGNLLGLCRLGNFLAGQMNLTLTKVNCFVGVEKLGDITKNAISDLVNEARLLA